MRPIFTILAILYLTIDLTSQSWVRQNPFPQLAQFEDIDFDGVYGMVVGDQNTVFTTTNGGINWMPRKIPPTGLWYQAALVVPGTSGQLLFAGGYDLIVSRDGGQTWSRAYNGQLGVIYKIQALPNGALVVHNSDFGLLSYDNGESWEQFNMPGTNITAGHFTSEQNGWIQDGGFDNNQVWVTTDGGDSWNLRDPRKHPIISSIEMIDDQVGFLASGDFVFKTTDGGFVWTPLHTNPAHSILDLYVVNENELWACQNNGFIFYTLDGGNLWQEINPNIINSNKTTSIFANDDGQVWVAGKYTSIMYSANFANNWTDQIPNSKATMLKPSFFNEDVGIVGGSEGTILRTTNGGASWESLQLGIDENFFGASMLSTQTMVVGSSSGKVLSSLDQGASWIIIGDNLGRISDIEVTSNLEAAVVVNESGKIFRTINGGLQWDEVYNDPSAILLGLDFPTLGMGWACGYFGQILHSTDGGGTWDLVYADDQNQFEDIHFVTPQEGWVVASNFTDTIWHTMDGGGSWFSSKLPYKTFWRSVSFSSLDTGWVAGGSVGAGIVLRTNDRGLTWVIDHQSPEVLFGIYAVPHKETVWATGVGGNIVKYSPCTFQPEIDNLIGDETPCERDTVTYAISSSDVDVFEWTFPSDWLVFGNPNSSSIQLIVGEIQGEVSIIGKDACGSVTDQLTLDVEPVPVTNVEITFDNVFLASDQSDGLFQWLLDGIPINGADESTYLPTESGTYALVVTNITTGCEVRSNAIIILIDAIHEINTEDLLVYPNPTQGKVTLVFTDGESIDGGAILAIVNILGQMKLKKEIFTNEIDLSDLPEGIYLLEIQVNNKIYQRKILTQ
jgi:photosystem II stability/assembly factor-like uncharacterized protein